jgi:Heavy metal binding domain
MNLKSIIAFTLLALCSLTACNSNSSETKKESGSESKQMAKAEYACPMECEKGKTYDATGKCPVCKMDLVAKSHKHSSDESEKKDSTGKEHRHLHGGEENHSHDKESK